MARHFAPWATQAKALHQERTDEAVQKIVDHNDAMKHIIENRIHEITHRIDKELGDDTEFMKRLRALEADMTQDLQDHKNELAGYKDDLLDAMEGSRGASIGDLEERLDQRTENLIGQMEENLEIFKQQLADGEHAVGGINLDDIHERIDKEIHGEMHDKILDHINSEVSQLSKDSQDALTDHLTQIEDMESRLQNTIQLQIEGKAGLEDLEKLEETVLNTEHVLRQEVEMRHQEVGQLSAICKEFEQWMEIMDGKLKEQRKARIEAELRKSLHRMQQGALGKSFNSWLSGWKKARRCVAA
eukprot:SAG31_NODE_146_length_22601_cov_56.529192_22_plen_301_part_00